MAPPRVVMIDSGLSGRVRRAGGLWLALAASLLGAVALGPGAAVTQAASAVPAFDHVVIIVMENHSQAEIIGNTTQAPYINQLAAQYGLATNYSAVTHPSLPNYLALIGGSTFGVTTDCTTCFVTAPNLVADRVAPSGRTWKAYMESMPSACLIGDSLLYAQKHNPFVYFDDVRLTGQCANVVPFTSLSGDLGATSTTPNYAWITPNLCNDMHDCPIATGDSWLRGLVPTILGSPAFTAQKSLLLITFDEDDGTQNNLVPMLVISPLVPAGFRSAVPYTHYSLLRTIEDAWALAPVGAGDLAASAMSDFFPPPPAATTRVNAGGAAFTGADGRVWQADTGFTGGRTFSTTATIAGTTDQPLYQTERFGIASYALPVPNGNYTVNLKFAETFWTAAGQRVFNVSINGQQVLTNFDILANTTPRTALDRSFPVAVASGSISIVLTTVVDNAQINAIEIVPSTTAPPPPPPPPPTSVRVNAGGAAFTGADGRAWQADTGFDGGQTFSTAAAIGGTTDQPLYQTERYGNTTYTFKVANGSYTVNLKFAEIFWTTAGRRVFNVAINGQQVLTNFDILGNTTPKTALDRSFPVNVTGGSISIVLTTVVDNAQVNAIEIVPSTAAPPPPTGTTVRVNAGGAAFTGADGRAWQADTGFTGGRTFSTTTAIGGTTDQPLYQTERFDNTTYAFAVTNGNYTVNLMFAEIFWTTAGKRVFNVAINGTQVLTNFDILANTTPNTALHRSFPVSVTGGSISIVLTTVVDNAQVNAIEIVPGP